MFVLKSQEKKTVGERSTMNNNKAWPIKLLKKDDFKT